MIEDKRDLEPIPEHGNDFIADVSERYFEFNFVNNGEYCKKVIKGSNIEDSINNLRKSLTGLFTIIDYKEVNVR